MVIHVIVRLQCRIVSWSGWSGIRHEGHSPTHLPCWQGMSLHSGFLYFYDRRRRKPSSKSSLIREGRTGFYFLLLRRRRRTYSVPRACLFCSARKFLRGKSAMDGRTREAPKNALDKFRVRHCTGVRYAGAVVASALKSPSTVAFQEYQQFWKNRHSAGGQPKELYWMAT